MVRATGTAFGSPRRHGRRRWPLEEGQPASLHIGLPESRQATIWLAAEALERLLAGADSLAALRGNGSITIEGGDAANRSEAWEAVASIALPARRMAHSG